MNLHTKDGGHFYSGGVSFPMEDFVNQHKPRYTAEDREQLAAFADNDYMLPTPEEAESWTVSVGLFFAVAVIVAVPMWALWYWYGGAL